MCGRSFATKVRPDGTVPRDLPKRFCGRSCSSKANAARLNPTTLLEVTKECAGCGDDFVTKVHPSTGGVAKGYASKYCSRQCGLSSHNRSRRADTKASYLKDPKTCPCGAEFPYEDRHSRIYCSDECTGKYGKKRQSDPSNYVTFDCESCGESVTRRKSYGSGALRFCSNQCSSKSNHSKVFSLTDGDDVIQLDSSWEALVFGVMTFTKTAQIKRVDRDEVIELVTENGNAGYYAPDFVVGEVYLEIKGFVKPRTVARAVAWRESGKKVAILDRDRIQALSEACLSNPEGALQLLEIYSSSDPR